MEQNKSLPALALVSVVSAFGTAVLMPSIEKWGAVAPVWWLCYLTVVAFSVGAATSCEPHLRRLWLAIPPAAMPLLYIFLNTVVLGRTMGLSGLKSTNPTFWNLVASLAVGTWLFTWLFSHSQQYFVAVLRWLNSKATEDRLQRVGRNVAAITTLVGVLGLLIQAFVGGGA